MKKLLIIFIILLSLGYFLQRQFGTIKIINSQEFTEDGKQIVAYSYKSDQAAPALDNEIITERTEHIVTRDLGGGRFSVQSGYNFYKENGEWKQVKFATTTKEIFDKETLSPISWLIKTVWAASQGAYGGGTFVDDNSIGTIAWSNPGNANLSDSLYATAALTGQQWSHYDKITNFGFTIPTGATINGIVASIRRKASVNNWNLDSAIYLVKDNVIGGNNRGGTTASFYIPLTEASKNFGSSTDLWGLTWTYDNINSSTFGIAYNTANSGASGSGVKTTSLNYISITVYYTEATTSCTYSGSGDWNVLQSDNCYITSSVYVNGAFNLIGSSTGMFGCAPGITVSSNRYNFGAPTNFDAKCLNYHQ